MSLPAEITLQDFYRNFRDQTDLWSEAVREICNTNEVAVQDIQPFIDGSNLVASVSAEHIVKIFPPFHHHQWQSEHRALKYLQSHPLSVPIPKYVASGERADRWTYLIMTKVAGTSLNEVWKNLSLEQKSTLMRQIGSLMREVHTVPVGELDDLEPNWDSFLKEQNAGLIARHQRLNAPEWFLKEAPSFVSENLDCISKEPSVILTGEFTPFNLLVEQTGDQVRLSGMIDFGDVMIGYREYDFLGPLLFLGEGNRVFRDALLAGYQYGEPTDSAFQNRLMLLTILHRYSNLKAQIQIENWENQVHHLSELKQLLFPI